MDDRGQFVCEFSVEIWAVVNGVVYVFEVSAGVLGNDIDRDGRGGVI